LPANKAPLPDKDRAATGFDPAGDGD